MKLTKEAINDVGAFLVSYNIGHPDAMGEDLFKVQMVVSTPNRTVTGSGQITNGSINPPLSINTKLDGHFCYMTVMPKTTHIQVVCDGYPDIHWPSHAGIGPVILKNVQLTMVLNEDWKTGVATYRYQTTDGKWKLMEDIPVNIADPKVLTR